MRKWLYDRPWIWIVVLLACVVAGGLATVIIAQLNRPEIVKPAAGRRAPPRRGVFTLAEGCGMLVPVAERTAAARTAAVVPRGRA